MKTEQITLAGADGMLLPGTIWMPEGETRAVLQVTHGMTEHMGRYTALAEELTTHGILVAGVDLRGHGRNPGDPDCASFGENGWEAALEDMHRLRRLLDERYPQIPHFMLGFSLGSFLLREYLDRYDDRLSGAVIMGTGQQPGAVLTVMMAIVKTQIQKAGFDAATPLVRQLSFGTYNQKFKPNRTDADWLCADERELDAYCGDALCRKDISAGLFWQLMGSMKRTGGKNAYAHWDKQLPVLLLSGQDDPVGGAGKGVEAVYKAMKKAGMQKVTMHLYPGARHDLLHEEASGTAPAARRRIADWILENMG